MKKALILLSTITATVIVLFAISAFSSGAVSKSDLFKIADVKYTQKKTSVTYNVGEKYYYVKDFYKVAYDKNKLKKSPKVTTKEYNDFVKKMENQTCEVTNSSVISLNKKDAKTATITINKQGTSKLKIKLYDMTFTVNVIVKKASVVKYKGKNSKASYSTKETYNALKDAFYNYIIKGNAPKYEYITLYYVDNGEKNVVQKILDLENKDFENGQNSFAFITGCEFSGIKDYEGNALKVIYSLAEERGEDDCHASVMEIDWSDFKSERKTLYNTAQNIFKSINISKYKEDYEKIAAINAWYQNNTKYNYDKAYNPKYKGNGKSNIYQILNQHTGVCEDYAESTTYLCTLLNIPCCDVHSLVNPTTKESHAWNAIKIGKKWYYSDLLWSYFLYGKNNIKNTGYHNRVKVIDSPLNTNKNLISNTDLLQDSEKFALAQKVAKTSNTYPVLKFYN